MISGARAASGGVPGVLDDEQPVPAGRRDQLLAVLASGDPAERVVQRRHRVDGPDSTLSTQGVERSEVGSVAGRALMERLQLDPARHLLAGQCSGTLVLAKLGVLDGVPACTDLTTKPWVQAAGVDVLDQPFFAKDRVAAAGGCLASPYLAGWLIARLADVASAESALHYVAPVGEKDEYVARAMGNISPYLGQPSALI